MCLIRKLLYICCAPLNSGHKPPMIFRKPISVYRADKPCVAAVLDTAGEFFIGRNRAVCCGTSGEHTSLNSPSGKFFSRSKKYSSRFRFMGQFPYCFGSINFRMLLRFCVVQVFGENEGKWESSSR